MGETLNFDSERNTKIFNTPIEIGLRTLFLLSKFDTISLSIDKLVYLDYFLIHSGDISKKQKSLHPKYPFRSSEIVIKREILSTALRLLIGKEMAIVCFKNTGIEYQITSFGRQAIQYFESDYSKNINRLADWVFSSYGSMSEDDLSKIINVNLSKWGSEFHNESKFRGISK